MVSLRAKGRNLIEISFRGETPDTTFRTVDGLVSKFVENSLKLTRTSADETVDFVKEDLKRLKRNLDESEKLLREFEEKHLDELPGSENSKQSRLASAENEYERNNATLMILSEKLSFVEEKMDKVTRTITGEVVRVPNPKVNELNKHINGLEIRLSDLRSKYFDEHPSIVTTLKSIDQLKKISFGVTDREGAQKTEILLIKNNGETEYSVTKEGYPQPQIKSKLSEKQIRKLTALIKETGFIEIPSESFPIKDDVMDYQKSNVKIILNGQIKQIHWPEQNATEKFIPPIITMVEFQLDQVINQISE